MLIVLLDIHLLPTVLRAIEPLHIFVEEEEKEVERRKERLPKGIRGRGKKKEGERRKGGLPKRITG